MCFGFLRYEDIEPLPVLFESEIVFVAERFVHCFAIFMASVGASSLLLNETLFAKSLFRKHPHSFSTVILNIIKSSGIVL